MTRLIGVAGGSGSGKTTMAEMIFNHFGSERASILYQDSYYIDRSKEFKGDGSLNFDHPDAIDWELMLQHLNALRAGQTVNVPIYDFIQHKRIPETLLVEPKEFVIVDGILLYVNSLVRELFDIRLFVETSETMRFARRLLRDVEQRGRTPEGVRLQYESTVKPMHDRFVEPCRHYAHQVIYGETLSDLKIPSLISEL